MKPNVHVITMAALLCILTLGCEQNAKPGPDQRLVNRRLINSYNDTAIENAIISQHTLFPYHFIPNGAELNELGQRDIGVLAGHFMKHPGSLNIRRYDTAAELYEARVNTVRERLREAGINVESMNISDGMPGGSGMPSERVLTILEEKNQGTTTQGISSGTSAGTAISSRSGARR
jgi:hypothetical protein